MPGTPRTATVPVADGKVVQPGLRAIMSPEVLYRPAMNRRPEPGGPTATAASPMSDLATTARASSAPACEAHQPPPSLPCSASRPLFRHQGIE